MTVELAESSAHESFAVSSRFCQLEAVSSMSPSRQDIDLQNKMNCNPHEEENTEAPPGYVRRLLHLHRPEAVYAVVGLAASVLAASVQPIAAIFFASLLVLYYNPDKVRPWLQLVVGSQPSLVDTCCCTQRMKRFAGCEKCCEVIGDKTE